MKMENELQSLMDAAGQELDKPALAIVDRAVREQHPAAITLLRKLLTMDGVSPFIRAALASYTRTLPDQEAELLMLSILAKDENLVVRFRACDVLMQVGSEGALGPLEQLASSGPKDERSIAGFAHAVVAHRLGTASRFVNLPDDADRLTLKGLAMSFESRPLSPVLQREMVADLEMDRFKLGRYSTVGVEIQCTRGPLALVLHDHVVARGLSDALGLSPSVLGVVARRNEEHRRWSIIRVVLGGPLGDGKFYIGVFRRDGQPDLFGTGRLEERTLELSAANRPSGIAVAARCYWYGSTPIIAGIIGLERLPGRVPLRRIVEKEATV